MTPKRLKYLAAIALCASAILAVSLSPAHAGDREVSRDAVSAPPPGQIPREHFRNMLAAAAERAKRQMEIPASTRVKQLLKEMESETDGAKFASVQARFREELDRLSLGDRAVAEKRVRQIIAGRSPQQ